MGQVVPHPGAAAVNATNGDMFGNHMIAMALRPPIPPEARRLDRRFRRIERRQARLPRCPGADPLVMSYSRACERLARDIRRLTGRHT